MLSHTATGSDAVARSYRRKAEQCLSEAEKAELPALRADWERIAREWLRLAETAERGISG
jgi:hypothetical protein